MLKISASVIGCFSGESYFVEMDSETFLVRIESAFGVAGSAGEFKEFEVAPILFNSFRDAVAEIIAKPEHLIGGRSTTVYKATVVNNGTEISAESSEIPVEQLIEIAADARTKAEVKMKIESALKNGYHNRTHEIFRITKEFVKNCIDGNRS